MTRQAAAAHDVAFDTVALSSVVAGAMFVRVAIALARQLLTRPAGPVDGGDPSAAPSVPLAAGLLLTQGYMQPFFGYVENYTWFTLALLAAWGLMRPSTRAAALRDSLLTNVLFVGVPLPLASVGGFSPREGLDHVWNLAVRGEHTDKSTAYLVSWAHLRDFFAFQMLMGPFAGLLVPFGLHHLGEPDA